MPTPCARNPFPVRPTCAPGTIICFFPADRMAFYRIEAVDVVLARCTLRLLFAAAGTGWQPHPYADLDFVEENGVEVPCFFTLWIEA